VNIAALVGANRDFILTRIPHISRLMVPSADAVLDHAQTIIIGNLDPEFSGIHAKLRDGQYLVDFVRMPRQGNTNGRHHLTYAPNDSGAVFHGC
jgi:GDP-mannose 6-dehydrogenase